MTVSSFSLAPDAIAAAAQELAQRRLTGRVAGALPASCRPATVEDALAVQEAVTMSLAQRTGDRVVGWKCGLPFDGNGVIAPLYASSLFHGDTPVPVFAHNGQLKVEQELAFVLAHDLPAREQPYGDAEVHAAVGATHLALELIDDRYEPGAPLTFADRLADGLVNQGLYLGPQIDSDPRNAPQEMTLTVQADGRPFSVKKGVHPAGDPMSPLRWLAEFLRSRGQGLRAGDVVITGAYAGAPWWPVGPQLEIQFGPWGVVSVRFQERPRTASTSEPA